MRYSDFKIFRFDFVSLYCLIYKIAQDMNAGNTVFSQLMSLIPDYELRKCIDRYRGDFHARRFTCRDQFLVMSKDQYYRLGIDNMVYAFDSSTINLCMQLCPWAKFHHDKGAFKMHTLIDVKNNIPNFIMLTPGNVHDTQAMISLTGLFTAKKYPDLLRLVVYEDFAQNVVYRFLTNDFTLEAITIAELYRERWTIETFFKWIKQHLHIKTFYGTSQNAVFTQIWIAICDYLLLIIALKMYHIE